MEEIKLEYDIEKYINFCKKLTDLARTDQKGDYDQMIKNSSPHERQFLLFWEQILYNNSELFDQVYKAPTELSEPILRLMFDGWCLCKLAEAGDDHDYASDNQK